MIQNVQNGSKRSNIDNNKNITKWSKITKHCQNGPTFFKLVKNGGKWSKKVQMVQNGPKLSKIVQSGPKWSKMVQNDPKWSKMVQKGPIQTTTKNITKWPKKTKHCQNCPTLLKWSKMVVNGPKLCKMVQQSPKWSKRYELVKKNIVQKISNGPKWSKNCPKWSNVVQIHLKFLLQATAVGLTYPKGRQICPSKIIQAYLPINLSISR